MKADVRRELLMTLESLRDNAHRHHLLASVPADRQERALAGYNREIERRLIQLADEIEANASANGIIGGGA
ncbi:hypothetical protein [Chromohalobacter moromii]|uniref:Uncharacterized protein n=1 Tax=Chromohalobacter moromii TaxID=2860329 RepID=A0A9X2X4F7_9GAMM|nr:hypothetical protein [Chromohalobacter moromii]MCK2046989.1 hypothetical protein [Chromohalobacter moromii]MCT8506566.1 hypothetical protein [Chromohalobacter moromii]